MIRRLLMGAFALAAGVAVWTLAQGPMAGSLPLAAITPPGAVLYLEAKDFGALLAEWNGSAEKHAWLLSANYQVFSRSRLFLRLEQSQQEFAAAAGLPGDMTLAGEVAGSSSALALYDIGQLQFLYVTRMPAARAATTALWKKRGDYQTRTAAGVQYYLREDPRSHKTAAFATAEDLLLVATREDLLTGALALLRGQGTASLAREAWFDAAVRAAGAAHDLRLAMNFDRLVTSPHFRSYWIQGNVAEMRQYSAAIADIQRAAGEIRESRVLLRRSPGPDRTATESAVAQLAALAPPEKGLYRAWAAPPVDEVAGMVEHKLLAPGNGGAGRRTTQAPVVQLGNGITGSEEDLDTRIDETPLVDEKGSPEIEALRNALEANRPAAMLVVGGERTLAGGVLVGNDNAIAVLGAGDWDINSVRSSLAGAAGNLWTTSGLGAGWTQHSAGTYSYFEMDGLARLSAAASGRVLILSDSSALLAAMLARLSAPAGPAAVYASVYRHSREFPLYQKLTRLIDFTASPAGGPQFFSGNVESVGAALARLDTASLIAHDDGSAVRESVVYRWMR